MLSLSNWLAPTPKPFLCFFFVLSFKSLSFLLLFPLLVYLPALVSPSLVLRYIELTFADEHCRGYETPPRNHLKIFQYCTPYISNTNNCPVSSLPTKVTATNTTWWSTIFRIINSSTLKKKIVLNKFLNLTVFFTATKAEELSAHYRHYTCRYWRARVRRKIGPARRYVRCIYGARGSSPSPQCSPQCPKYRPQPDPYSYTHSIQSWVRNGASYL